MFSHRNALLHGRALQVNGSRSLLCCRAVKMQMTGLTSCCRKRTYGQVLQLVELSQRRFPNRPFARSGAGCRPSISGWRSSCAGTCWLTGCTQRPPLGSHVNNFMHCFWQGYQGQPQESPWRKSLSWTWTYSGPDMVGAMQRVDGILQGSKCTWSSWPAESFTGPQGQGGICSWRGRDIYGTLCKEVADQRGHLPAQATSTLAGCERPAWARKGRRRHDGHLKITRMAWRITTWWKRSHEGLRGASRFTFVSHLFAKFHWTLWVFFFVCWFGVLCSVLVCVGSFCFWDGLVKILHSISTGSFHVSSSWPTMLRARSAMQEKKTPHPLFGCGILSSVYPEGFRAGAVAPDHLLNSNLWKIISQTFLPSKFDRFSYPHPPLPGAFSPSWTLRKETSVRTLTILHPRSALGSRPLVFSVVMVTTQYNIGFVSARERPL